MSLLCSPPLKGRIARYTLFPCVCLSICLPRTQWQLKMERQTTFKLTRKVNYGQKNWKSNFEVRRSKIKVTASAFGKRKVRIWTPKPLNLAA